MALKIEGIVNGGMHAQEPLRGARRLESLHFALSPSHRLMRVLGSIVAPDPLFVRQLSPNRTSGRGRDFRWANTDSLSGSHLPRPRCSGCAHPPDRPVGRGVSIGARLRASMATPFQLFWPCQTAR
jgi:hypothetical protein